MSGLTHASPTVEAAPALAHRKRRFSPWREAWRRFSRHRLAAISVVVLALLALSILIGPLLWPVAINDIDFTARLSPPSWDHPFGTDDLGQDLLARMIYGGRISLAVGFAAMAVAMLFGTVVGAIAGVSRGSIDAALMWVTDLFLALPQLPLLLLVIYLFRDSLKGLVGPEGGVFILIVLIIAGFRWMPVARLVRAQFLSLREKEFVAAAIITESTLSFLGLGFPPDIPTWGRLLYDAKDYLDIAPHWALFAGGAIFLTVIAINLIGDGLRDALDPRKVM